MLRQDVVKRVEFEATVCSDNTLHDDHALSSVKQVCATLFGLFQDFVKLYSVGQRH